METVITTKSFANHVAAADIAFQCLGSNQVKVTVNLYADCGTANQQIFTTLSLQLSSAICNYSSSPSIPLLSGSGVEVPTSVYPPCGTTTCNGGSAYGVYHYIYEGIVPLPQACSDWKINTEMVTRNSVITTVINPQSYSLFLEANFDNLNYPTNSSPVFSTPPVSLTCLNQQYTYSNGATDVDLDTLSWSLISARGSVGPGNPVVNLQYVSGYSRTNPMSSASGFTLNSQTGLLSFIPDQLQVGVVAEEIHEFRNGTLIGTVMRDMQLNVTSLCNILPDLSSSILAAVSCNDSILDLHLDQLIQCSSASADGSDFRLLDPSGQPIPVVSVIPLNCTSGLTDHLSITLNNRLIQNGTYKLWSKRGNDSNTLFNRCGNEMLQNDTLNFSISDCFTGVMDLLNVSVSQNNDAMEITWQIPGGVNAANFFRYYVYRSDLATGPFIVVDTLYAYTDTFSIDLQANVQAHEYYYAVKVEMNTGFISSLSDTIQSIFLDCTTLPDSTLDLDWTPYNGWPNPDYAIVQYDSTGAITIVNGNASSIYRFSKPKKNGAYHVRIRTISGSLPPLVSLSNWCDFSVHNTEVIIPNIITPNDDKKNDKFVVQNLDQYPNSRLEIFNRWGKKVYENADYRNDWDGANLEDGTYFYMLHVADNHSTEQHGTLMILRK